MTKRPLTEIFTDGACSGNPGPGGWAALVRTEEGEYTLSGCDPNTTNNRMEMMAAIEALASLKTSSQVILTTDSEYVRKGMTEWVQGWIKRGWRTADKQPVKNVDLWQRLVGLNAQHQIEWKWVKGHNGFPENEQVDRLARDAIQRKVPLL